MIQVCIVGVGLIGGSLGKALRRGKARSRFHVVGLGRSVKNLNQARRSGAIDEFSTQASAVIPKADIVVLCVPVQQIVPLARKIAPLLKNGAIVTDAGSVKASVMVGLAQALSRRKNISFVGGHPIAGSERTGVENAKPDLFKGAVCVLCKGRGRSDAEAKVRSMWQATGARCVSMKAHEHDQWLAFTSHLPHLLSFSLFSLVQQLSRKNPGIRSLTAGSFRDMTRVAASDPDVWTGIFSSNRGPLKQAGKKFLPVLKSILSSSDQKLHATLNHLSRARKSW